MGGWRYVVSVARTCLFCLVHTLLCYINITTQACLIFLWSGSVSRSSGPKYDASVCVSVSVSLSVCLCLCFFLSVCLPVCLSVSLYVDLRHWFFVEKWFHMSIRYIEAQSNYSGGLIFPPHRVEAWTSVRTHFSMSASFKHFFSSGSIDQG